MYAYHNSHSSKYRNPLGAVPAGGSLRLTLDVHDPVAGTSSMVRIWHDPEGLEMIPMKCTSWGDKAVFEADIALPETPGLFWYSFVLENLPHRTFYGNNDEDMGGEGRNYAGSPKGYQVTVYEPFSVPRWYTEGIVYQIFPDRFRRGSDWPERMRAAERPIDRSGPKRILRLDWRDEPFYDRAPDGSIKSWDFFGGTLEGIREKLFYLKSLGVTAIYLNPIFEAASNHKYDTGDYMKIDPGFGDEESFKRLIDEAAGLDIHIILDGVFSHTGADSRYFDIYGTYFDVARKARAAEDASAEDIPVPGAAVDRSSPYFDWYSFTNWPADYECWWGVRDLPNVHELNPSYLRFITGENGVLRHYSDLGVSGWRLDVADELPDEFIRKIRETMQEADPDSLLLGEVWEDASNKVSYGQRRKYLLGAELQSVMNYPFRDAGLMFFLGQIDSMRFTALMLREMENYPREAFFSNLNLISSHDRERALTLLGEAPSDSSLSDSDKRTYRLPPDQRALGVRRLKALSLLQFAFPGVPSIYYGDEAGLEGMKDPYNRGTYPWGTEDTELLSHYRMVTTLRKQHPALRKGDFEALNTHYSGGEDIEKLSGNVLGFVRSFGNERITVLVSRNTKEEESAAIRMSSFALELAESKWFEASDGLLTISLPPLGFKVLKHFDKKPESFGRKRSFGVLVHTSAVPGDLCRFLDFLHDSGAKLWQILPLNPTGTAGSPYQSPGVFAGDTGLSDRLPPESFDETGYRAFCEENRYWLHDFALYKAIKKRYSAPFWEWPEKERTRKDPDGLFREYEEEAEAECKGQYLFHCGWMKLTRYAHSLGISIIGDIPLSVAEDSADTWAHPEIFELDESGRATMNAGAPPDYFNPEGQNWGTPTYDWDELKKSGFKWWVERMRRAFALYDFVRLDHFRGFSEYYSIPAGESAEHGGWRNGPGIEFFEALKEALPEGESLLPVIAEDLGNLDMGVYNLLKETALPGMDVYEFEEEKMFPLPSDPRPRDGRDIHSRIYYSSTHDSPTLYEWCEERYSPEEAGDRSGEILTRLYDSPADWVIIALQDILGLGREGRFNTPGTVGPGNWSWQADERALTEELAASIREKLEKSGRL